MIHTVGPVWHGGKSGEREKLTSCYKRSLELAAKHDCAMIAFPLISAGVYGYPKEQALSIAVKTIRAFLMEHEMEASLVLFDMEAWRLANELFSDLIQ